MEGNESIFLPGQDFAEAATRTKGAGGLLFSAAEIAEFNDLAKEINADTWDIEALPKFDK